MIHRMLSLFALLSLISVVQASDKQLPFLDSSFEEVKAEAEHQQKPFLIYFHKENNRDHRKMVRKTWHNKELRHYLSKHFLCLSIDDEAAGADSGLANSLRLADFPAIVFFDWDGNVMGKVYGYLTAPTLQTILDKHLETVNERRKKMIAAQTQVPRSNNLRTRSEAAKPKPRVVGYLSDLNPPTVRQLPVQEKGLAQSSPPPTVHDLGLAPAGMVSRGQMETTIHLDVPGMDQYSLKNLNLSSENPATHGLLIGSYISYNELRASVDRFNRVWKSAIWVYCEEVDGIPVYKLALGAYQDREEAEVYANAIYKFEKTNTAIIDLALIRK